jgi:hypothetical protein
LTWLGVAVDIGERVWPYKYGDSHGRWYVEEIVRTRDGYLVGIKLRTIPEYCHNYGFHDCVVFIKNEDVDSEVKIRWCDNLDAAEIVKILAENGNTQIIKRWRFADDDYVLISQSEARSVFGISQANPNDAGEYVHVPATRVFDYFMKTNDGREVKKKLWDEDDGKVVQIAEIASFLRGETEYVDAALHPPVIMDEGPHDATILGVSYCETIYALSRVNGRVYAYFGYLDVRELGELV